MVVKGLNKFINLFEQNIIDCIDIRDEIANWKREHNGDPPEVLIDLKELPDLFVQTDQIGAILGGRYGHYNEMLCLFLKNITKAGAKLIFFMPGRQHSDDTGFFIPKIEGKYIDSLEILDVLEEKSDLNAFLRKKSRPWTSRGQMALAFMYNLKILVSNFGDIHVTHALHNHEIAHYGNENADRVLATISNNTDFVAFSGTYQFWHANSIHFKQLKCNRYNKLRLYDKLGFEHGVAQMQLLSALCGSIYLPFCAIEDFLNRLGMENNTPERRGKIWNVTAYVKRQPFEMVNNKLIFDLERIGRDVFGDDYSQEQLNAIANGLTYYDLELQQPTSRDLNVFLQFCKKTDSFTYKLATDEVFNVGDITYMDYRSYKSKSYAELVIPILMKMCGILFRDEGNRPIVRKICMKHAHDEPSKVTEEAIIYPKTILPELFDLVFKHREQKYDKLRWSLLEWALNLNYGVVKELRDRKDYQHFAVVIVTLQYLVQQEELTPKEANIILYTELQTRKRVSNKTVNRNFVSIRTEYPKKPCSNYVRIAHLYVKMYVLISHCFDVCGLHKMTGLLLFDGALSHKNMDKFNAETEQLMDELKSTIEPIWIFA